MRTFHEHERVRRVVRTVAVLRDSDLGCPEPLPNRQRDDGRVVRGDLGRVRLDLRVERLRPGERVRVVVQERRDLLRSQETVSSNVSSSFVKGGGGGRA